MCLYCMIGDFVFRHDPPFPISPTNPYAPLIPQPVAPLLPGTSLPWTLDKLREFEDLLRRVKALEDQIGCPCEPNKADYLSMLRDRIEALEARAAEKWTP